MHQGHLQSHCVPMVRKRTDDYTQTQKPTLASTATAMQIIPSNHTNTTPTFNLNLKLQK